jgi:twitching motility protein PilT
MRRRLEGDSARLHACRHLVDIASFHFTDLFMADTPTLQPTLPLPTNKPHGIGAAVRHALMFAPSMTDIIIHEGQVIRAKSARGTLPLHQLFTATPPFLVTREHIATYLAGYVDGATRHHQDDRGATQSAQDYWNTRIKPVLARQHSVNIRLDGRGGHSLRCSLFMHGTGELALVMRITPPDITPLADLSLPHHLVSTLAESTSGFIVITGPTGSGKSETAMSILDWHNAQHSGHILTIEDPVEKKIRPRKAIVTQREVGHDVPSFADGMREAMRTSPDVLLTSEIRDAETAEQAIQGGDSGSLMVATTHGKSVTGTMRKILSYTGPRADVMRSVLAGNLIAVVRQALVPARDGKRYLMAADVLFNAGQVTRFIERGDWIGLEGAMREDDRLGTSEWAPMNDRLVELVERGEIEAGEAMRETSDIPSLRRKLAGIASLPGMR